MNSPEKVCKTIHYYVSPRLSGHELHRLGWYDFMMSDRPDTVDPVLMACEAFLYVCVKEGKWICDVRILSGICAFLQEEAGVVIKRDVLVQLRGILQTIPVPADSIRAWFKSLPR